MVWISQSSALFTLRADPLLQIPYQYINCTVWYSSVQVVYFIFILCNEFLSIYQVNLHHVLSSPDSERSANQLCAARTSQPWCFPGRSQWFGRVLSVAETSPAAASRNFILSLIIDDDDDESSRLETCGRSDERTSHPPEPRQQKHAAGSSTWEHCKNQAPDKELTSVFIYIQN